MSFSMQLVTPVEINLASRLPPAGVSHSNKEVLSDQTDSQIQLQRMTDRDDCIDEDTMLVSGSSVLHHASTEIRSAPNRQAKQSKACVC